MKKKLRNPILLLALVLVPAAAIPPRPAHSDIRYCCTTQQVQACTAQGGTTSCRTDICRCWF